MKAMSERNPYAPPASVVLRPEVATSNLEAASRMQRALNLLIDSVGCYAVGSGVGAVVILSPGISGFCSVHLQSECRQLS